MDEQRQGDQLELTYSSSGCSPEYLQWMIGSGGDRGSGISVLIAQPNGDDDDDDIILFCKIVKLVNKAK